MIHNDMALAARGLKVTSLLSIIKNIIIIIKHFVFIYYHKGWDVGSVDKIPLVQV